MPTGGAIRAGRAFVELFGDDTKLRKVLDGAQKRMQAFAAGIRTTGVGLLGVGTAAGGGLLASAKLFSTMGDDLEKMSQRTGVSVESLSQLGFAAGQSGTNIEALESGLQAMSRVIVGAGLGSKKAADSLALVGLTVEDLKSLKPEEQFRLIAERISKVADPTRRAAAAMRLLGGTDLIPLLKDGAAGIDLLTDKAKELGLTISTADAHAAAEFNDTMGELLATLKRATFAVGAALAPELKQLTEIITGNVAATAKWIGEHRGVVTLAAAATAAVIGLGTGLIGLSFAGSAVAKGFGLISGAVGLASTGLKIVLTTVGALISPLGLLTTAVAAAAVVIVTASGTGSTAIADLGDAFTDMKSVATGAVKGIVDALSAGDIELAGRILFKSLELVWDIGVAKLNEIWVGLIENMKTVVAAFVDTAQGYWDDIIEQATRALLVMQGTKEGSKAGKDIMRGSGLPGASLIADSVPDPEIENENELQKAIDTLHGDMQPRRDARNSALDQRVNEAGKNMADAAKQSAESLKGLREELSKASYRAALENSSGHNAGIFGESTRKAVPDAIDIAAAMNHFMSGARGTFNPFEAARGFGSDGSIDLLKKISKNTKDIADNTEDLGIGE
jgi:hypothetical protein